MMAKQPTEEKLQKTVIQVRRKCSQLLTHIWILYPAGILFYKGVYKIVLKNNKYNKKISDLSLYFRISYDLNTFVSSTAGKQDVKNVRSLFLKRKHRVEPLNTGDGPAMSESSPPGHCGIFFLDSCYILWIHLGDV